MLQNAVIPFLLLFLLLLLLLPARTWRSHGEALTPKQRAERASRWTLARAALASTTDSVQQSNIKSSRIYSHIWELAHINGHCLTTVIRFRGWCSGGPSSLCHQTRWSAMMMTLTVESRTSCSTKLCRPTERCLEEGPNAHAHFQHRVPFWLVSWQARTKPGRACLSKSKH